MDRKFKIIKVTDVPEGTSEVKNTLNIKNLTKEFEDAVLENYSEDFVDGIYLVIGESGCGKTTLMRCIAGLTDYDGEIILNGKRLKGHGTDVHMVHQHYFSFPWMNELQNVLMVHKGHKTKITPDLIREAKETLEKTKISDRENNTPMEISGGQDQRLSICSALVNHESRVFIYDEPTSALDMENTALIAKLIREHQEKDHSIEFIVTHDDVLINAFAKDGTEEAT